MIEPSLYIFAAFVFALLCLFALICKSLFSKSKATQIAAEEKEKKLLTLYSTVEEMMDELGDNIQAANDDIAKRMEEFFNKREQEIYDRARAEAEAEAAAARRLSAPAPASAPTSAPAATPRRMTVKKLPKAKAKPKKPLLDVKDMLDAIEPPAAKDRAEKSAADSAPAKRQPEPKGMSAAGSRLDKVLGLYEQGMNRVQIAKELGVTLAEVDLVLEIAAKKKA